MRAALRTGDDRRRVGGGSRRGPPRHSTWEAGMCRWLAYYGNPIRLGDLLHDAPYSLVEQSRRDRLAGGFPNADGFGVGWYGGREEPGLYRNILPAWADRNLRDLAN